MSINGDRSIAINSGSIYAHGDVIMNNSALYYSAGNSTIYVNGINDQAIDGRTNYTGLFPAITIEKNSGTVFLKGIIPVGGNWEYKMGNFDAITHQSTMYFSVSTSITGNQTFYNLTFAHATPDPKNFEISNGTEITSEGLLLIKGDRTIRLNGNRINAHGDIKMENTSFSIY